MWAMQELTVFVRANAKKAITLAQTDAEMDTEDLKDQVRSMCIDRSSETSTCL